MQKCCKHSLHVYQHFSTADMCGNMFFFFTLKEDVDVADKALAAEVRDNMEPWRLRLVSEP